MAGGAGRRSAAGHAANAGTNTSGAGGLYPIEAWGNDDLGLAQSVENLAVEQLIAQAGVEALNVAVIRYVGRRCLTCSADPRGLAYGATIRDMGTGST